MKHFLLTLFTSILAHFAFSQTGLISEAQFIKQSLSSAAASLNDEQRNIYSGRQYNQYFLTKGNDGHPFFASMKPESIVYDGIRYTSVDFIYDIFLDEIVVAHPDSSWLTLDKSRVSEFAMIGHQIKRMDSVRGLIPGFYEVLFDNHEITLLARWTKRFRASVWIENIDYFIVTDRAYPVSSKKMLLSALKNRDTEIRQFLRDRSLRFGKTKRQTLIDVVRFYISLN